MLHSAQRRNRARFTPFLYLPYVHRAGRMIPSQRWIHPGPIQKKVWSRVCLHLSEIRSFDLGLGFGLGFSTE